MTFDKNVIASTNFGPCTTAATDIAATHVPPISISQSTLSTASTMINHAIDDDGMSPPITDERHDFEQQPFSPVESTCSFMSSISGIAEKSASELGVLLKNAYKSIKEKEKNLYLAAEVGKSLLEHNQTLKSDYEQLLQNVKYCGEFVQQQQESLKKENSSGTYIARYKKQEYDAMIETLERKNTELEQLLETMQHESDTQLQSQQNKQRKLETEIELLKVNLDAAASKIEELEETQRRRAAQQVQQKRHFDKRHTEDVALMEQLTTQMEGLFQENKQLQVSKRAVEEKLRLSLQDLDRLRQEFEHFELTHCNYQMLKEAFEQQTMHIKELNASLEDHRSILTKLHEQGLLWSPSIMHPPHQQADVRSPTTTVATHTATTTTTTTTPSSTSLFSSFVHQPSLMDELDVTDYNTASSANTTKQQQQQRQQPTKSIKDQESFSDRLFSMATATERNISLFCHSPADYAMDTIISKWIGVDYNSSCSISTSPREEESDTEELFKPLFTDKRFKELNLYPVVMQHFNCLMREEEKKDEAMHDTGSGNNCNSNSSSSHCSSGLLQHLLHRIRYLIHSLLRWCRFVIVLTAAIFMNLWKGPDSILLEKC